MTRFTCLLCLLCLLATLSFWPSRVGAFQVLELGRTRIAVSPDGSVAIAHEEQHDRPKVSVQLYTSSGVAKGPRHLFEGESCSAQDQWTNDWVNTMDLEFRPDGRLFVVMRHGGDTERGHSNEAALHAIDPNGELIDLADDSPCMGSKIRLAGGGDQYRPRLSISEDSQVFLAVDGTINGSNGDAVASLVLSADLDELVEPFVPHEDKLSMVAQHYYADIVIKGSLVGMTWSKCPFDGGFICDIEAQFMRFVDGDLQPIGNVQLVNSGDSPGTDNDWSSIAMNGAGRSVIVWIDSRASDDYDVFGQLYDGEKKVGDNFQISTGQAPQSNRPEVAMKDDGGFMVVWEDGPRTNARGREFGPAGAPLGPPFLLETGTHTRTQKPHVATNGSRYLYAWTGSVEGVEEVFSNLFTPTAEHGESPTAVPFALEAYPSPFGNALTASFTLPQPMAVTVDLYDILGRHVARLADGPLPTGRHSVGLESADLPNGLYALRLVAGKNALTRVVVHAN